MKQLLSWTMLANAAIFLLGALQHAGIGMGSWHEPRILPATIVETVCALFLLWGGVAVMREHPTARRAALTANFVALGGVVMGMIALAAGAGPRTETNDLTHGVMLTFIAAGLTILFTAYRRTPLARS